MILTEAEAGQKYCPQIQILPDGMIPAHGEPRCVASRCMMWRVFTTGGRYAGKDLPARGYCGLAGKPDK